MSNWVSHSKKEIKRLRASGRGVQTWCILLSIHNFLKTGPSSLIHNLSQCCALPIVRTSCRLLEMAQWVFKPEDFAIEAATARHAN